MSGLGAEEEVNERVKQSRGVDGPLHDCDVRLALQTRDELGDVDEVVVGEHVVPVEDLEGCPVMKLDTFWSSLT